jgi:N-acetylneuraminic acid mutarotase
MINPRSLLLALCAIAAAPVSAAPEEKMSWTRVADLNTPQQYHACVSAGGKIYAVGGYNNAGFEEYDVKSNVWRVLPAIPTRRAFPAAAVVARRIYVIGGLAGRDQTLASVECFDLDARNWQHCADLPTPRNRLAAVALAGKILVIGGMDEHGNSSAVEEFDPGSNRWRSRAGLLTPRHGLSAVTVGEKVLVLGGYGPDPLPDVEEYDPSRDHWTKRADMPTPRGFFGAATAKGFVFAIAGRVKGDPPVERYDPRFDTWQRLGAMPGPPRSRFGIAAVGESIYIVGGERQMDRALPLSVWRYEADP